MTSQKCQVCNSVNIEIKYQGNIRNGKFPNIIKDATILKCLNCDVEFLPDYNIDYSIKDYRDLVDSDSTVDSYYRIHDNDQFSKLSLIELKNLRGKKIVDIGCGAGSFLDLVKGYTSDTFAIEPAKYYHDALNLKKHKVFSSIRDLLSTTEEQFDYVTSFSVIEHVDDPIDFIISATKLLKPGGVLIISTPNSNDVLLDLIPREYASFFYRVVHKWYFNQKSLSFIFKKANLDFKIIFKHRFGLSNLIAWCNEKKPNCTQSINFTQSLDAQYKQELESKGISDYIYIVSTK